MQPGPVSLERTSEVTPLLAGTTVDGYSGKSSRILMPQLDIYEKACIEFYLSIIDQFSGQSS